MNTIQRLREIGSLEGTVSYYSSQDDGFREKVEEVECLLQEGTTVKYSTEDGGRWSVFQTDITRIVEGNEVAYFLVSEEVPATEMQDGMDCYYEFYEVVPEEVKQIIFVPKEEN